MGNCSNRKIVRNFRNVTHRISPRAIKLRKMGRVDKYPKTLPFFTMLSIAFLISLPAPSVQNVLCVESNARSKVISPTLYGAVMGFDLRNIK